MQVIIASPWVPVEWVAAHGHELKSAWLFSPGPGASLGEGVCPVAQAMAELAANTSGVVSILPTTCDQLRRAGDAVCAHAGSRIFSLNLPATWQTDTARAVYLDELKRLGRFLVRLGGHPPSDAALARTAARFNDKRRAIFRTFQEQPGRGGAEATARCFDSASEPGPNPNGRKAVRTGVPLALLGGAMFASEWPLFDAVEAAGGAIVLNAAEPGERCLPPPVPLAGQSLRLESLANHYFENIVDVFRRPNSQLYSWLEPRLKQRRVRGIMLLVRVGCDLWRAEAAGLREAFRLPLLVLDSHRIGALTTGTAGLRDVTRLTAFIESLQ